jgi:hypothetical protein
MWQIMCGYLIIVKINAKTRFNYKCYTNGQMLDVISLMQLRLMGLSSSCNEWLDLIYPIINGRVNL